ncbi:hypothetical protein SAY86_010057 [Trapa natans]|uniref:PH domain-containing protein n=1 Tax=Trapa natans TaxID=22666 RepID=A0AAN7KX37_TRANT|nr:hypothetical protein SAY86_010057 [Trapa natans]
MRLLCCISTVSEDKASPPSASPHVVMPVIVTAHGEADRSDETFRPANQVHSHDIHSNSDDRNRPGQRLAAVVPTTATVTQLPSGREHPVVDVKLNDIIGNGVSGILHKWVNYGKGWRFRWFILQDGVLSYYKIHGPRKIVVNQETVKGSKIIGEESMRKISRSSNCQPQTRPKPLGEIHLKICSIRDSKPDDKRFSIFTGMKKLHLRAETREDCVAWIESLQAVKDMFPRMSNSELMAPVDNIDMSTEKLRKRLQQEGLREAVIQESEQIMKTEFSALQQQLLLLKQKHFQLIDTLGQLETEKVDLENTVIDENQRQNDDQRTSAEGLEKDSETNTSESEDDNERIDVAEEETDDEDHIFFDTCDFPSSSSFKGSVSDHWRSSFSSNEESLDACESDNGINSSIRVSVNKFPFVNRRKKLPNPVEKEKGVSLWSMIKDNIGKDLTKICLPVYFNEPLSSLQKCFEDLEYSYLLDRANEWGKRGNSLMRILNIAAFAVSGYSSTEGRSCKPFNPLLGETYEADYPDKGLRFISEKVSHHPMILACHCEGTGWKFWADSNLKSKFWGRSIQLDPVGTLTLEFDDGEVFQWSKVTTSIYNLILGKLYCDHYGTVRIEGNHDYSCKLKFKEQSIIDRNPHQVHGVVQDKKGKTVATLFGKWDESMYYLMGDSSRKDKETEPHLLWKRNKPPSFQTRYNLTNFAITLNEITSGLKDKLPPTDSRLRPDQRYLENGQFEMANAEKQRLEQRQRQARNMQESGWKPRWFVKDNGSSTFRYTGGYWEAREQGDWESCPNLFSQVPADQ